MKRGFGVVRIGRTDLEEIRKGADRGGLLKGCEAAVHLAARAHVLRETEDDPLSVFRVANRDTTLAFARACARAENPAIRLCELDRRQRGHVHASFPPGRFPGPGGAIRQYQNWRRKAGLWEIARTTGLGAVAIRPPLVYGPDDRGNFLRLLKLAALPLPLPLGLYPERDPTSAFGISVTC